MSSQIYTQLKAATYDLTFFQASQNIDLRAHISLYLQLAQNTDFMKAPIYSQLRASYCKLLTLPVNKQKKKTYNAHKISKVSQGQVIFFTYMYRMCKFVHIFGVRETRYFKKKLEIELICCRLTEKSWYKGLICTSV